MAPESNTDAPFVGRPSKLYPFEDRIGFLPDREIAMMAGVSPENVRTFRKRRRIPAWWRGETSVEGDTGPAEAPVQAAPKAAATVAAKASPPAPSKGKAAAGKGKAKGKKRPGRRATRLDPFRDRLGLDSDRAIAALAGTSIENVRAYRKRHSIPALWQNAEGAPTGGTRENVGEEVVGPSRQASRVAAAAAPRIAPAPPTPTKLVPTASPRRGTAARARQWAYRVTADVAGEVREYVTFGDDVVDAAEKARSSLRSEHAGAFVTRIEVVGVAL